jgi:hypothetical protein
MSRPVVVISGRHRPHQLFLMAVSLVLGTAYTLGAPPPQSLAALLPGWALLTWSVGMLVAGAVGLWGAWRSLRLEQAGLLLGAAALAWYVAAVAQFGWRALLPTAICVAWAGANVWRAGQIQKDLRGHR